MSTDWSSLFGIVAQVSVTAFSIMFLSLQVKSDNWRGRRLLHVAAVAALVELFVPMLVGLVASMGSHPWRIAAALGGGLGLSMVAIHMLIYSADRNRQETSSFDRTQAWGALLSSIIYALIATSACLPWSAGMYLLGAMCTWLLLSGSFEAWWLLSPKDLDRSSSQAVDTGSGAGTEGYGGSPSNPAPR